MTAGAKQNQLASYGAGPCVIIALWNPDVKKAGMAHIDNSINDSLQEFVKQVASGAGDGIKIQVHLVGGTSDTIDLQVRLLNTIKNNPALKLVSADPGGVSFDDERGQSLAINAKTGKVHNSVEPLGGPCWPLFAESARALL